MSCNGREGNLHADGLRLEKVVEDEKPKEKGGGCKMFGRYFGCSIL